MRKGGFTLVEVLVATAILLIITVVLLQVIAGMTNIWHNNTGTVSNFETARSAFTTLNRVVARATLKTYVDYVNDPTANSKPFGNFRTTANTATFTPASFARASELHFICGPATAFTAQTGATAGANPGDAIFFQAPLGVYNNNSDKYLQRSLNCVGFYIQYGDIDTSIFPTFLQGVFGAAHHYGFRLIEYVQPTENVSVYNYTSTGAYSQAWLPATVPNFKGSAVSLGNSVLAENILLLIFRPRLEPQDESVAAASLTTLGTSGVTYSATDPTKTGSIISPNYNYDSRTWTTSYTFSPTSVKDVNYGLLMRNQLPPIVDVVMVCADPNSLVRLNLPTASTPPAYLLPTATQFLKSDDQDLNNDLQAYGDTLTKNHIRYKVFRSSVEIQGASWANQ